MVQPVLPGLREAGAVPVLVHRSARLADQPGELPERDLGGLAIGEG
jgi:hypothetical protein